MVVAVVLVNGLKRQKRNVRLKRLKTKCLEASLFAGYDQEDEYDDVDEDDFAPFVEAVELGYFNNSPVVVSRSNQTAAASSNSDTVASVSSTPKSK